MRRESQFRLLLIVLIALVAVVALELGARFVLKAQDQGTDPVAGGRHLYHPYRSHQLNPTYVRDLDTHGLKLHSADGFRSDRPIAKDRTPGVIRIVMMGGSALYGIGAEAPYPRQPTLKNDETVPARLEARLNAELAAAGRNEKVEVINAAVVAYRTFHHLVYFNETLYEYRPDLVLFLDGHNDFYHYEVYNNWQTYVGGTESLTRHFDHRGLWFTALANVRFLAQYSNVFMVLEKAMQRSWPEVPGPRFAQLDAPRTVEAAFPANVPQLLDESIMKTYRQLKTLGEMFDFEMMVFLQPQVAFEKAANLSPGDREIQSITARHEINPRRAELRPLFPEQFRRHDIAFADIADIATEASSGQDLYLDYCHLSPAGSVVAAERMLPHVKEMVWRRLATRPAVQATVPASGPSVVAATMSVPVHAPVGSRGVVDLSEPLLAGRQ